MDWDATKLLDDAADRDVRRALLDHLLACGYSLELLNDAHKQGRLYALGGDQTIRPGRLSVTLAQLAQRLELDLVWTRKLWGALGLTDPGAELPVVTESEVEGYRIWADVRSLTSEQTALSLARVHGAAVAKMTEAVAATMTTAVPEIDLVHGGDELTAAQMYEVVSQLVPRVTGFLDLLYRQHLGEATRYLEAVGSPAGFGAQAVPYCVAFADLSGFTAATVDLSADELAALLAHFETTAYDEAARFGGRCAKLIGDAAMLVCASPDGLAEMAHQLIARMHEQSSLLPVRVAMAAGDVVFRDGDYFGAPVNLAARLLSLCDPGEVVADEMLASRLDSSRWRIVPKPAQPLKGLPAPVVAHVLHRAGVSAK